MLFEHHSKSLSCEKLNAKKTNENKITELIGDELDKTLISTSQLQYDLRCTDKNIKSKIHPNTSKFLNASLKLMNDEKDVEPFGLKKFIENKLNVKIESTGEKVAEVSNRPENKPTVFDKFFKSFNGPEENKIIPKQNEQNLSRIFELLKKKTVKQEPIVQHSKSEDNHSSTESTNMIKLLLKIDKNDDFKTEKNERESEKLEAAFSIYKNCPTTLNKILSNTKNPIIVDTSHQPGK